MSETFDISNFISVHRPNDQYKRQIERLKDADRYTDSIEETVKKALENILSAGQNSFVIYGEPQSGKTEMMICLTAKLLDEGYRFIIHLLNDSVDLLEQNIGRFHSSGLAPSAQTFMEILDPGIDVNSGTFVVFSKKNGSNLRKLSNKIGHINNIIVIDDEADYATPNSLVNQHDKTPINKLIEDIIGDTGHYIGVTATPARLNLNNALKNDSKYWVRFAPHPMYTGQDVFFPMNLEEINIDNLEFRLELMSDKNDDFSHERNSLFRFMINVAHLNISSQKENNYSMLIHTSGKKLDHKNDYDKISNIFSVLSDPENRKYESYVNTIWKIAGKKYGSLSANELTMYVIRNVSRNTKVVLNSEAEFKKFGGNATNPSALFTIVIGGNIVSRGVTFNNLLSMFFSRDAKNKIQQDTYIQRARMFGSRRAYLSHFELTIPEKLYADWHRCFVYHRLALASIENGLGSPVWIADKRIAAVADPGIDKSTVDLDRGEMSFALFDFSEHLDRIVINSSFTDQIKINKLADALGDEAFPKYLREFILHSLSLRKSHLKIFPSAGVFPSMSDEEKAEIKRRQGFLTIRKSDYPENSKGTTHFLRIFRNDAGKARLFYKFGDSIQFIKNLK
ncbi:Z1 domain-containing protein (plasmid) [Tistrella mobilis]|uniref:Z1 domain-containing protein n=1 Tax=Tistrella mobilis TaxID=171437 RepID=UPI0035566353